MPAPAERRRRGALPALPVEAARAVLSPPRVPLPTLTDIARARRAAAMNVPVWIEMPVGGGRTLLARALHAEAGRPGPLLAAEGSGRALRDLPPGATVLVDVARLTAPAVAAIEALLDDATAWPLLLSSPGDAPPPPLDARLAAVTIRIPPLAQRASQIGALAAQLLSTLSARRGAAAPRLGPSALDWLAAQPW